MAPGFFSPVNSTNVRSPRSAAASWRLGALAILGRLAPPLACRWAERLFRTPPRRPLAEGERTVLATGRAFAVGRGPRRLAAWRWGTGPRVVLVHGWGGRGAQLGAFVSPLVASGFSVVMFDAPGHGASDGTSSSLPEFAAALRRVVAETGPAYAVLAHSLGAAASALAMRDGLPVERAVFLGPPIDPAAYLRRFLARVRLPQLEIPIAERLERRFRVRWADLHLRVLARRLTAPLLVVHDRQDAEVPWEDGAAIVEAWPNAELVTTTGLGHRRLLRDATVVSRAVAFLGQGRPADAGRPRILDEEPSRCATPGCPRPGVEVWGDAVLCCACALERELFDPESRWRRGGADLSYPRLTVR